jgi:hypothetical protein
MIAMAKAPKIRVEVPCSQAAKLLGCTMGRVRQMCRAQPNGDPPILWSRKVTPRALVLDLEEVRSLAKARQQARDAGIVPGKPPGGFVREKRSAK